MSKFGLFARSDDWPLLDVDAEGGLSDLLANRERLSRKAFRKNVFHSELAEVEESLGYADHNLRGKTMASDPSVTYFFSKWHGERVYGFFRRGIAYVFTKGGRGHTSEHGINGDSSLVD